MAIKNFGKSRTFLNPIDKGCMAALQWDVTVYYDKTDGTASIEGDLSFNREAQYHHVWRPKDLKAIERTEQELLKFKDAVKRAFTWCEEQGYKTKHTWSL